MNLFEIKEQFFSQQIDKGQFIDKMYSVHSTLFDYAQLLGKSDISKIEIVEGEVIMTFRNSGVKFICSKGDKRQAPFEALNFGSYEEDELKMQMSLINEKDTVLDIGANCGWYSAHMAKKFPFTKIYSFEPIFHTCTQLLRNLSINHINNVTALNIGLGEENGSFIFYYDSQLSANASMSNLTNAVSVTSTKCEVSTLDNFVKENDVKVNFIKCDVEGAELLVFKGGKELLKRDTPIIISEMLRKWTAKFNYHPNDIIEFLKSFGYNCYTIKKGQLNLFTRVDDNTVETNYFFLHPERHASQIAKLIYES